MSFNNRQIYANGLEDEEELNEVEIVGADPQEDAKPKTATRRSATQRGGSAKRPRKGVNDDSQPAQPEMTPPTQQQPPPPQQPPPQQQLTTLQPVQLLSAAPPLASSQQQTAPYGQPPYQYGGQQPYQYGGQQPYSQQQQPPAQPAYYAQAPPAYPQPPYQQPPHQSNKPVDIVAERQQAREELRQHAIGHATSEGARITDYYRREFKDESWILSVEKALKFHLCDACTKLFIGDREKVMHLGGGYRLVSLLMCPTCTQNNNEAKRTYKELFPSTYKVERN